MRMILMCFTLAIACSGLVQAAGDSGLLIPSVENSLIPLVEDTSSNRADKSQRKSSYRSSTEKRSRATTDRNSAANAAKTEKGGDVTSADDSDQPWTIALLALGGLAVVSVSAFFVIRAWRAGTAGRGSRGRSSGAVLLATSLVQKQIRRDEATQTVPQEKITRRAA